MHASTSSSQKNVAWAWAWWGRSGIPAWLFHPFNCIRHQPAKVVQIPTTQTPWRKRNVQARPTAGAKTKNHGMANKTTKGKEHATEEGGGQNGKENDGSNRNSWHHTQQHNTCNSCLMLRHAFEWVSTSYIHNTTYSTCYVTRACNYLPMSTCCMVYIYMSHSSCACMYAML